VFRMNAHSNPPEVVVIVRDHNHFESLNDFVAFNRPKIKSYEWYHRGLDCDDCSTLTVSFHNRIDALLFKLSHG
jgi:hypothetical protein